MLFSLGKEGELQKAGRSSPVGKLLPEDLHVHRSALEYVPGLIKLKLSPGESIAGKLNSDLVKFSLHGKSLSFLFYPEFDTNPHPPLAGSVRVDFRTGKYQFRDYSKSESPPILHRKDTFVSSGYELYQKFKDLIESEEKAGLLSQSGIGFQKQWQALLKESGYSIVENRLEKTDLQSS